MTRLLFAAIIAITPLVMPAQTAAETYAWATPALLSPAAMLLRSAAEASSAERDALIVELIEAVEASTMSDAERYLLLAEADDMEPSDDVRCALIRAIGRTHTLQALGYMRRYYDVTEYAEAAAEAVWEVLTARPTLNGGRHVRELARQAMYVSAGVSGDKAATKRMFDLSDLLEASKESGYTFSTSSTKMGYRGFWAMKDGYDDFAMSFDFRSDTLFTVVVRSVPLVLFEPDSGVSIAGASNRTAMHRAAGQWNTADVALRRGRLSVRVNGEVLLDAVDVTALPDGSELPERGDIGFVATKGLVVRYLRIKR